MAFLGKLGSFLFGSGDKTKQLPTMNPEQLKHLQQLLTMLSPEGQLGEGYGQSLSQLQEMLDPDSAAQARFAEPYMRQFNEQTIPGLSERFAGMGAQGGALSSSGFGQALSSAGAGLQSNLASLKSQLQQNAMQQLMQQYGGMSQSALGRSPFGYQHIQGSQGAVGSALPGILRGLTMGMM